MKKSNYKEIYIILAIALVALGVFGRFIPHPPNFTPIAAIAIFAGAVLPRGWSSFIPLAAIIVSDVFIGLHSTVFYTWGAFAMIAVISSKYLKNRTSVTNTVRMALFSSTFFYLVTNFGVWAQGKMYAMNLAGLMQSYVNGLPFFRYTFLGDLVYTGAIFGLYYLGAKMLSPQKAKQPALPL